MGFRFSRANRRTRSRSHPHRHWRRRRLSPQKDEEPLPENVRIITLPAYSPELNPVEKLWGIVKDGICNRDWADLDQLEEKITERIKPYWEDAKRVTRLIGDGYLLFELNAIWKKDFRQYN